MDFYKNLECLHCKKQSIQFNCTKCNNCAKHVCDDCFHFGLWLQEKNDQIYPKTVIKNIDYFDSGFTFLDEVYYVCSELCSEKFHKKYYA